MITAKSSQLQSSLSTHESCAGVTNVLSSYTILNQKKFTRKRENSNESTRKIICISTPKSTKSNTININQKLDTGAIMKGEQYKNCSIIKQNTFIKWLQSPTQKQIEQNATLYQQQNQSQNINRDGQHPENVEKAIKQQRNQTPKLKFSRNSSQQNYRNCHNLKTSSIRRISKLQLNQNTPLLCNLPNYPSSFQQKQADKTLSKPPSKVDLTSQIKILQNQIIILQDENSRLKKQIKSLLTQKQSNQQLTLSYQQQIQNLQHQLLQNKQLSTILIKNIKKQLFHLQLQICQNLQSATQTKIRQENQLLIFTKKNSSSPTSKSNSKIKSNSSQQKLTLNNFHQTYLQPTLQTLKQSIQKYSKILQKNKTLISKLQIKNSIMMRNTEQLKNIKNQNIFLHDKIYQEKNKFKKIKQEYESLKKQCHLIKLTLEEKNLKNRSKSKSLHNKNNKPKSIYEEGVSLCFSDLSEEEGITSNSSNRR